MADGRGEAAREAVARAGAIPRRVVLHVGMSKAGSTAIQNHLDERRAALLEQGVLFPASVFTRRDATDPTRTSGHLELIRLLRQGHPAPFLAECEAQAGRADTLLLSAENLFHHVDGIDLRRLRALLDGAEITLVAVLRDPAGWLASRHHESVAKGFHRETRTLDAFALDALDAGELDTGARLEVLSEALRPARVVTLDYEALTREGRLVSRFREVAGLAPEPMGPEPTGPESTGPEPQPNASHPSPEGTEAHRQLNAQARALDGDAYRAWCSELRGHVRSLLEEGALRRGHALPSRPVRERIAEAAAAARRPLDADWTRGPETVIDEEKVAGLLRFGRERLAEAARRPSETRDASATPLKVVPSPEPRSADAPPPADVPLFASRAPFTSPRALRPSPWLAHAPFAFWLAEVLAPRLVVDLGLDPVAHLALCQSLEEAGAEGRCVAVRPHGADGAAPAPYPDDLARQHEVRYGRRSRIVEAEPAAAAALVADGSVDLLRLDLATAPSAVEGFARDWSRKLGPRAVILVHGAGARLGEPGVAALVEGLRARHREIAFPQGGGLAAFLVGEGHPRPLVRLVRLAPNAPERAATTAAFARLGRGLALEAGGRVEVEARAALARAAASAEARVEALAGRLAEREAMARDLAREVDALRQRAKRAERRMVEQETTFAQLRANAKAEAQERFEEIVSLTRLLVAAETAHRSPPEELGQAATGGTAGAGKARGETGPSGVAAERRQVRDLEARHAALLNSHAWRAAALLRRLARRGNGGWTRDAFLPVGWGHGLAEAPPAELARYARELAGVHAAARKSRTWRVLVAAFET